MTFRGAASVQNRFGIKVVDTAGANDTGILTAAVRFLETMYTQINAKVSTFVSYNDVTFWNGTTATPLPSQPWATLTAGSAGSDPLPSGVSGLVIFRTGVSKRFARKFLPPFAESTQVSTGFDAGTISDMADFAAAMLSAYTDGTNSVQLQAVVPSYLGAGIYIGTQLLSAVAYGEPAYQRRRRVGRGI